MCVILDWPQQAAAGQPLETLLPSVDYKGKLASKKDPAYSLGLRRSNPTKVSMLVLWHASQYLISARQEGLLQWDADSGGGKRRQLTCSLDPPSECCSRGCPCMLDAHKSLMESQTPGDHSPAAEQHWHGWAQPPCQSALLLQ